MICDYGCEQEAKFRFNNGKNCCCSCVNSCPEIRRKMSEKRKGKNHPLFGKIFSEESKRKMSESHKGKSNPMKGRTFSDKAKKNMSDSHKGQIPWNKGLKTGPISEETKFKLSLSKKGKKKPPFFGEKVRRRMKEGGAKHAASFISEESKKKHKERMLNGQAARMNKCIKNPSKPETNLRKIVKELYPECEFQYQIFNYSIDIALPFYKIAIEYDGYYHFCDGKAIEYHNRRQKNIEEEGWKFLRYNIFQEFPSKEKVKDDLRILIKE